VKKVGLLFNGGSIGFYSGDMRLFNDDIQMLKPTVIPAVPNVLNRMYDKVRPHPSKSKKIYKTNI